MAKLFANICTCCLSEHFVLVKENESGRYDGDPHLKM